MIAIIDYGMGNLHSVSKALNTLGCENIITSDPAVILAADKVILPGVGAFKDAIDRLQALNLDETIRQVVEHKTPLLGICLGMQLLFEKSLEFGEHKGLGILKGTIVHFDDPSLIVPHMGWNYLIIDHPGDLFKGMTKPCVYFVHSYYLDSNEPFVTAYTEYGKKIAVAIQSGSVYAVQFHPEKSGDVGLQILKNFGDL